MVRKRYPYCAKCGGEINPNKYDGCDRYYLTDEGPLCRECYLEDAEEYLRLNTEEFAALTGVPVVYLEV